MARTRSGIIIFIIITIYCSLDELTVLLYYNIIIYCSRYNVSVGNKRTLAATAATIRLDYNNTNNRYRY